MSQHTLVRSICPAICWTLRYLLDTTLPKKSGGSAAFLRASDATMNAKMLDSYDPVRAVALFEKLKKNNVWQCPTLVIAEANAKGNPRSTSEDKEQLGRLFQK